MEELRGNQAAPMPQRAFEAFRASLLEVCGEDTDVRSLGPVEALEVLWAILSRMEERGLEVNWEGLSLYVPDCAQAALAASLDHGLGTYVWNGVKSEEPESCMAVGRPILSDGSVVRYHCSCVLVGSRHVLTARHCVEGMENGKCFVSPRMDLEPRSGWFPAQVSWKGEDLRPSGSAARNDIAILEVDFGGYQVPRSPSIAPKGRFGGPAVARLAAYGPKDEAPASSGSRRIGIVEPIWRDPIVSPIDGVVVFDPATEFVCGPGKTKQDGLPRDSGGGVYLPGEEADEWLLAGILSRGAGLANSLGAGAIYTKVYPFLEELQEVTGLSP